MLYIIAGLVFLAMQSVIAWRVWQIKDNQDWFMFVMDKRTETAIRFLGEIKMKQADFDKKVDSLTAQVAGLDAKLDGEAGEIAGIVAGYKDEIQRLKDSQGDNIDTSRLDALSSQLDGVGTRIGGLVDPLPASDIASAPDEEPTPAPTVDEQPAPAEEAHPDVPEVADFPADETPASANASDADAETETTTETTVTETSETETADESDEK